MDRIQISGASIVGGNGEEERFAELANPRNDRRLSGNMIVLISDENPNPAIYGDILSIKAEFHIRMGESQPTKFCLWTCLTRFLYHSIGNEELAKRISIVREGDDMIVGLNGTHGEYTCEDDMSAIVTIKYGPGCMDIQNVHLANIKLILAQFPHLRVASTSRISAVTGDRVRYIWVGRDMGKHSGLETLADSIIIEFFDLCRYIASRVVRAITSTGSMYNKYFKTSISKFEFNTWIDVENLKNCNPTLEVTEVLEEGSVPSEYMGSTLNGTHGEYTMEDDHDVDGHLEREETISFIHKELGDVSVWFKPSTFVAWHLLNSGIAPVFEETARTLTPELSMLMTFHELDCRFTRDWKDGIIGAFFHFGLMYFMVFSLSNLMGRIIFHSLWNIACFYVFKFRMVSQLNGSHGEVTNEDDMSQLGGSGGNKPAPQKKQWKKKGGHSNNINNMLAGQLQDQMGHVDALKEKVKAMEYNIKAQEEYVEVEPTLPEDWDFDFNKRKEYYWNVRIDSRFAEILFFLLKIMLCIYCITYSWHFQDLSQECDYFWHDLAITDDPLCIRISWLNLVSRSIIAQGYGANVLLFLVFTIFCCSITRRHSYKYCDSVSLLGYCPAEEHDDLRADSHSHGDLKHTKPRYCEIEVIRKIRKDRWWLRWLPCFGTFGFSSRIKSHSRLLKCSVEVIAQLSVTKNVDIWSKMDDNLARIRRHKNALAGCNIDRFKNMHNQDVIGNCALIAYYWAQHLRESSKHFMSINPM